MKNDITELVFILDMSGSMSGLTDDTIGGFNSMLRSQKGGQDRAYVTTYVFNNRSRMLHDRKPIDEIPDLTVADYCPSGCTALMDCMGEAITHIEQIHRYVRPEDVPEKTLFLITTDGMENDSHRYSSEEIKKMVERKTGEGWEFIYLAQNIDAAETAKNYGIRADMAVDCMPDAAGTSLQYEAMNIAVRECRARVPEPCGNFRKNIDEDYRRRRN